MGRWCATGSPPPANIGSTVFTSHCRLKTDPSQIIRNTCCMPPPLDLLMLTAVWGLLVCHWMLTSYTYVHQLCQHFSACTSIIAQADFAVACRIVIWHINPSPLSQSISYGLIVLALVIVLWQVYDCSLQVYDRSKTPPAEGM